MAFRLRPDRSLGREIQRIVDDELSDVLKQLAAPADRVHGAVHEARRAFKRLRGLLRLVQDADPDRLHHHRITMGKIARDLSPIRDAAALVDCCRKFEPFVLTDPQANALSTLSAHLTRKRDKITSSGTLLADLISAATAATAQLQAEFQQWKPDIGQRQAARILKNGWRKTLKRANAAMALCTSDDDPESFHDLRKAAQLHVQHVALLYDLWPSVMDQRRAQTKALSEKLGEEHDIAILAEVLSADRHMADAATHLAPSLAERQLHLRQKALELATPLFSPDPAFEASRIACLWRRDAAKAG